jgi:endonuclease III
MRTRASSKKAATTSAGGQTSSIPQQPLPAIEQPDQLLPTLLPSVTQPESLATGIGEKTQTHNADLPKPSAPKRKRTHKTPAEPVRGGWDVLPHNLGQLWTPSATSDAAYVTNGEVPSAVINDGTVIAGVDTTSVVGVKSYSLRLRKPKGYSNNGATSSSSVTSTSNPSTINQAVEAQTHDSKNTDDPPKKRQRRAKGATTNIKDAELDALGEAGPKKLKRKARKTKDNPYGLSPGETPYPEWESPSAEQCEEVYRILADMHDDVQPLPPVTIPAPSLQVAGCGEVPSILDGLIRTVLSGSTTFDMADKMLQALVKRFGVLKEGVGKGSVDWNNVRTAEYDHVYQELKHGGLGASKTKSIQSILQLVYDENMERREAYLQEQETGVQAKIAGAAEKTNGQKDLEILRAEQDMLSLDHMHSLTKDEAMRHFVRYPGVGVKTAACVTLFSLQRPCFAVDTHVYRMSRWLGWVPQKTNEDNTFSHLEVRCPDKLKYGLHQLFIRHGKTCYRCNDKSFLGTEAWNETKCPLEKLVNRFSKRAAKPKEVKERKGKSKANGKGKEQGQAREVDENEEMDDAADEKAADKLDLETEEYDQDKNQGQDNNSDSELSELDEDAMDFKAIEG